jgi:hypothetical protein
VLPVGSYYTGHLIVFMCLLIAKWGTVRHNCVFIMNINLSKIYWSRDAPTGLTANNCTLCLHCICVFCIYLRTNSDLCHLQHKLIGFYNRDKKYLLRGTDWVFNWSCLPFVLKGLNNLWMFYSWRTIIWLRINLQKYKYICKTVGIGINCMNCIHVVFKILFVMFYV